MPDLNVSSNGELLRMFNAWLDKRIEKNKEMIKQNKFNRAGKIYFGKEETNVEQLKYYASQIFQGGRLGGLKTLEFVSKLVNIGLIDNAVLRKLEEAYSKAKDESKFVNWLKKHPSISSYLSYYLAIALVSMSTWGSVKISNRGAKDDKDGEKKEVIAEPQEEIIKPKDNEELFNNTRSKIKFALAFAENYYPYVYFCGEAWTTGHGLTILYNIKGKAEHVSQKTKVPTLEESDVYKGRYLTYDILPDIKKCIKVPMDENTLIAACALRYCIGSKFKKSSFVEQLNAGKTGKELAKYLTGWRQQKGIPNRLYFFAALMSGEITFDDLLYLRAEGCYNLQWTDIFVYENGSPKQDKEGFFVWDFSKVQDNLEKAKQPRSVRLNLGRRKSVNVECKLVKDIVPEYIWQEVSCITNKQLKNENMQKRYLYANAIKRLQDEKTFDSSNLFMAPKEGYSK